MNTPQYIDCCRRPELSALRTLYESTHDLESLQQCTSCEAYWLYRFHEYTDWSTGNDDLTSWFTLLTSDEGIRILNATGRNEIDLSFLSERSSWMDDSEGVRRVDGAPDHPGS